jgi:hypothetical protein
VGFVGLLWYVGSFEETFIDDAFITFTYARNVVDYGTWGFLPDRTSNTATSPLNVLVLALFALVTDSIIDAAVWATAAELALLFVFLRLAGRFLFGGWTFAAFGFAAFAANPLLLSTIGLESLLFVACGVAGFYYFVSERWRSLAVALGLLTLTRADGALLSVVLIGLLPSSRSVKLRCAALYVLLLVPWYVFSWVHLGSVWPDTLKIKMGQAAWGPGMTFHEGLLMYLRAYPLELAASFWPVLLGLLAVRQGTPIVRRAAAALIVYGVGHYAAYSLLRVPPYHWYYTSEVMVAVLIGSLGVGVASHRFHRVAAAAWSAPVVWLVAVLATLGVPLTEAPIHTNWVTHSEYRELGLRLNSTVAPHETVSVNGEIGTVGYYSERLLVNEFSDMNVMTRANEDSRLLRTPVIGDLLRLSLVWRDNLAPLPPVSYHLVFGGEEQRDRDLVTFRASPTRWIAHLSGADAPMRIYLRKVIPEASPPAKRLDRPGR